jgi:hypothetical protein
MLPSTWNTDRLACRDVNESDGALISAWLRESADVAALQHLRGQAGEFWARVYLGNPRALAFWTRAGLRRVALHRDAAVHDVDGQRPNLILAADVGASPVSIEVTDAPAAVDLEAVDSEPACNPHDPHGLTNHLMVKSVSKE